MHLGSSRDRGKPSDDLQGGVKEWRTRSKGMIRRKLPPLLILSMHFCAKNEIEELSLMEAGTDNISSLSTFGSITSSIFIN